MTKANGRGPKPQRQNRQNKRGHDNRIHVAPLAGDHLIKPRSQRAKAPIEPLNQAQHAYMSAIHVYDIIFSVGPFGTGKTYVAAALAAEAFLAGDIDQIIVTRPAVGADEEYGFLPGELEEKVAPWAAPVIKILEERMGAGHVEYLLASGRIEIAPLGMLRGRTFKDAWVLFDEAQNCTPSQMKLFLSRIGENAKMIIDGDLDQKDIPGPSGLLDGMDRMEDHPQVGFIRFGIDDIVRSGLARDICIRYSQSKGATVGHAELGRFLGC